MNKRNCNREKVKGVVFFANYEGRTSKTGLFGSPSISERLLARLSEINSLKDSGKLDDFHDVCGELYLTGCEIMEDTYKELYAQLIQENDLVESIIIISPKGSYLKKMNLRNPVFYSKLMQDTSFVPRDLIKEITTCRQDGESEDSSLENMACLLEDYQKKLNDAWYFIQMMENQIMPILPLITDPDETTVEVSNASRNRTVRVDLSELAGLYVGFPYFGY